MTSPHEGQCKVCQYGVERIDWGLSNVAISDIVDCSEAAVRRHKVWAENYESPTDEDYVKWEPIKKWDKADGSVGYSYRRADTGDEFHLDNKRIDSLIRNWPFSLKDVRNHNGYPEFACPADLQLGKSEKGVGTDDTIRKFYESIEAVAQRWELLQPSEGYLADLGDLIENIFSTKNQVSTNDRTLPEQLEDAVAVYVNAIGRLLPLTGKLYFVTVTSNHGEARNEQKGNPYDSENDWGLHIQRVIENTCKDRGWDVTFIRPKKYEDTAVVTTSDGTTVAFTHGHHSGTPTAMEKWVTGQIVGRCEGWDANIWVHGHYHNPTHFSVGKGIDVFGTPSLDPGSAWFEKKSGKSARQGIVAFTVNEGQWYNYSIL